MCIPLGGEFPDYITRSDNIFVVCSHFLSGLDIHCEDLKSE